MFSLLSIAVGLAVPLLFCEAATEAAHADSLPAIKMGYQGPEGGRALKVWTLDRLQKEMKWMERSEDGGRWEGVLLFTLIEKSFEELSPEERSLTDWVLVTTSDGRRVSFPRFLANRYQVMIGRPKDASHGGWRLLLPMDSQPKIKQEMLPLSSVRGVSISQITLTRLEAMVAQDLFLKDRTNPVALRGEKRFLQTCVSCHQSQLHYQGALGLLKDIPPNHPKMENWSRLDWLGYEMYRKQVLR